MLKLVTENLPLRLVLFLLMLRVLKPKSEKMEMAMNFHNDFSGMQPFISYVWINTKFTCIKEKKTLMGPSLDALNV